MAISTSDILDVLAAHGIRPGEGDLDDIDFPEIGDIGEGETVYSTSVREVFGYDNESDEGVEILDMDNPRLVSWWKDVEWIVEGKNFNERIRKLKECLEKNPIEPHCAWYCPIHYFGYGWGIYIREECILSHAVYIAAFVDWTQVRAPKAEIPWHLLRSAFYAFYLHEQFHHKVESFGFRLLVSSKMDCYRTYKRNAYRPTYLTPDCLEESLANAESYRRLGEPRYVQRIDPAIRSGLREFLEASIQMQPPGYQQGIAYLSESSYRAGLYDLQSRVLDGRILPTTSPGYWSIAPNMITSLANITDDIYVILPLGTRPIFRSTSIDPGHVASSRGLEKALTKYYGYQSVAGGKGSHVKLKKKDAQTIILPGNKPVLSPGIVKHALNAIGGYPISRLPDLLTGKLPERV